MKALDKDGARYETANAFANDIERFLLNDTVAACPPSTGYRFRKFVRRNRSAIATASVAISAIVIGLVFATWQAFWLWSEVQRRTTVENSLWRALHREQQSLTAAEDTRTA